MKRKRIPYSFRDFQDQFRGTTEEEALIWLNQHFRQVGSVESEEWKVMGESERKRVAAYFLEHINDKR